MHSTLQAVESALTALNEELDRHAAGAGTVSSPQQLAAFRTRLEAMKSQLESDQLPPKGTRNPGMGRVIADSWPYDSDLGTLILTAERRFREA